MTDTHVVLGLLLLYLLVFSISVFTIAQRDIRLLIAEVEGLQDEVKKLRAIIATNPVQKRLAAQTLDATSEGKGKITFPRKGYDLKDTLK